MTADNTQTVELKRKVASTVDEKPMPRNVAEVFARYPAALHPGMLKVRRMIFETAAAMEGVGPITETLKWGEPAYLTSATKSGSTIRIGAKPSSPGRFAVYFNCQTNLVDSFREMFSDILTFEGNRAIVFKATDNVPETPLPTCIAMALTYHLNKRSRQS